MCIFILSISGLGIAAHHFVTGFLRVVALHICNTWDSLSNLKKNVQISLKFGLLFGIDKSPYGNVKRPFYDTFSESYGNCFDTVNVISY